MGESVGTAVITNAGSGEVRIQGLEIIVAEGGVGDSEGMKRGKSERSSTLLKSRKQPEGKGRVVKHLM